jgi:ABC-2 family transporter protein
MDNAKDDHDGLEMRGVRSKNTEIMRFAETSHVTLSMTEVRQPRDELLQRCVSARSDNDDEEDERASVSSTSDSSSDTNLNEHSLSAEYHGDNKTSIINKMKNQKRHHHCTNNNKNEHKYETSTDGGSASSLSLGCIQLRAMVRKNLLTRCRAPVATMLELVIPVLLILIIVYEYKLSDADGFPGGLYHVFRLPITGPWIDVSIQAMENTIHTTNKKTVAVPGGGGGGNDTDREREGARRLLLEKWLFSQGNSHWLDAAAPVWLQDLYRLELEQQSTTFRKENSDDYLKNHRRLQDKNVSHDADGADDFDQSEDNLFLKVEEDPGSSSDIWQSVTQAAKIMLKNPMRVPTLREFIQGSEILSSSLSVHGMNPLLLHSNFLSAWGNLLTLGTLHLSPADNPVALQFEQYVNDMLQSPSSSTFTSHKNHTTTTTSLKLQRHVDEATAVQYIEEHNFDERLWALIDFSQWHHDVPANGETLDNGVSDGDEDSDIPLHVKYKIRMNQTTLPNTDEIVNYHSIGLNPDYQKYYLSGYLTLQRTLNDFAFHYFNLTSTCDAIQDNNANANNVWSMPMPTARYTQNEFFLHVGEFLGTALVLGFLFPVSLLIKSLVEEKESRMRETLYILGIQPWAHWTSWLISAVLPFSVIGLTVASILATTVLKFSNFSLLLLLIGLFLWSTIGFCFCIAALFSNAKLSSIVGPMAFFATILRKCCRYRWTRPLLLVGKSGQTSYQASVIVLSSTLSFLWLESIRGCKRKNGGFAIPCDGVCFWL